MSMFVLDHEEPIPQPRPKAIEAARCVGFPTYYMRKTSQPNSTNAKAAPIAKPVIELMQKRRPYSIHACLQNGSMMLLCVDLFMLFTNSTELYGI